MNAKQEILDALAMMDVLDTRPFDPTLCGFVGVSPGNALHEWCIGDLRMLRHKPKNQIHIWRNNVAGVHLANCPWPATQSDGETLLRLLGVLK